MTKEMNKDYDNEVHKCEFYPTEKDDPICDCGSDISGSFVCTKEYSLTCLLAKERRHENE